MERNHRIKWAGGLRFIGTSGSGHSTVIDGDRKSGLSPMELLLLGTGGCACIDVVMILEKGRQKVIDARVEIGGERREELPRYFTDIEMHFVVKGIAIKEDRVKRAIDLAMEKYCSASAQMAALADIKTSYEIIEADTP
ncbi:MAG: OsmC family protein [Xanthomonadales bacterium]|nr:OsmC family protein [Xanthomonadales bacterium]